MHVLLSVIINIECFFNSVFQLLADYYQQLGCYLRKNQQVARYPHIFAISQDESVHTLPYSYATTAQE